MTAAKRSEPLAREADTAIDTAEYSLFLTMKTLSSDHIDLLFFIRSGTAHSDIATCLHIREHAVPVQLARACKDAGLEGAYGSARNKELIHRAFLLLDAWEDAGKPDEATAIRLPDQSR